MATLLICLNAGADACVLSHVEPCVFNIHITAHGNLQSAAPLDTTPVGFMLLGSVCVRISRGQVISRPDLHLHLQVVTCG